MADGANAAVGLDAELVGRAGTGSGNTGAISIYVSDPTDVLFDIGGYLGPGQ